MPKMNRADFVDFTEAEGYDKKELLALIFHRDENAPVSDSDSYESLFDYYISQYFPVDILEQKGDSEPVLIQAVNGK